MWAGVRLCSRRSSRSLMSGMGPSPSAWAAGGAPPFSVLPSLGPRSQRQSLHPPCLFHPLTSLTGPPLYITCTVPLRMASSCGLQPNIPNTRPCAIAERSSPDTPLRPTSQAPCVHCSPLPADACLRNRSRCFIVACRHNIRLPFAAACFGAVAPVLFPFYGLLPGSLCKSDSDSLANALRCTPHR